MTTPVIGVALCLLVVRARYSLGHHGSSSGVAGAKKWGVGSGSGGSVWYGMDVVQAGLHVEVYDFFLEGLIAGYSFGYRQCKQAHHPAR